MGYLFIENNYELLIYVRMETEYNQEVWKKLICWSTCALLNRDTLVSKIVSSALGILDGIYLVVNEIYEIGYFISAHNELLG